MCDCDCWPDDEVGCGEAIAALLEQVKRTGGTVKIALFTTEVTREPGEEVE